MAKVRGASVSNGRKSPSEYSTAHYMATPQSGPVVRTLYDKTGSVVPQLNSSVVKATFSAIPVAKPPVIIMVFP